jgi:HSP20 family protein
MDRLFDELMQSESQFSPFAKLENSSWDPAIELRETDAELIVKAEVPGVEAKDLDVQVSGNAVSIAGEHRAEQRHTGKGYFHSELQYGQFQRIIPFPVAVQPDQVKAEFKDGLLTLTLPKAAPSAQSITQVNLTTQEKAREAVVQQRQQDEHWQETMRSRTTTAMTASHDSETQAEARELMAKQRQHVEHLRDTMHQRSTEQIH